MRQLILLLLMPLVQLNAQTYTYKPLLSTSDWRVQIAGQGGYTIYWYHQAFKITENNKDYTAITDCDGLHPIVYIREDVASRKVYYMNPSDMQEYLLFNFNLRLNDKVMVPLGLTQNNSSEYKVIGIDTISLPDGKHKRFTYRETGGLQQRSFVLIEGIGCTDEPFKVYYRTADPVFYLLNSYQGRQCQYKFQDTCPPNPCTTVTGIDEPKTTSLKAWPNPCSEELQIDSETIYSYIIYNTMGQVIQAGECLRTIDMSELESGLYELVLESEGQREVLRVVRE